MATYGIQVRVRRITVEDAFVEVFLGEDMWVKRADGSVGVDVAKVGPRAIETASLPDVDWQVESREINPHDIQTPKPDDRRLKRTEIGG